MPFGGCGLDKAQVHGPVQPVAAGFARTLVHRLPDDAASGPGKVQRPVRDLHRQARFLWFKVVAAVRTVQAQTESAGQLVEGAVQKGYVPAESVRLTPPLFG